eukprot:359869-Chlamydomonas_euryale.AAC.35
MHASRRCSLALADLEQSIPGCWGHVQLPQLVFELPPLCALVRNRALQLAQPVHPQAHLRRRNAARVALRHSCHGIRSVGPPAAASPPLSVAACFRGRGGTRPGRGTRGSPGGVRICSGAIASWWVRHNRRHAVPLRQRSRTGRRRAARRSVAQLPWAARPGVDRGLLRPAVLPAMRPNV